jgi:hypothetical protein
MGVDYKEIPRHRQTSSLAGASLTAREGILKMQGTVLKHSHAALPFVLPYAKRRYPDDLMLDFYSHCKECSFCPI